MTFIIKINFMENKPQRGPGWISSSGNIDKGPLAHVPTSDYRKEKQAHVVGKAETAIFKTEESRMNERYLEITNQLRDFVGKQLTPEQKIIKQQLLNEKKKIDSIVNEKRIFQDTPKFIE
jgi:hypothetical protein